MPLWLQWIIGIGAGVGALAVIWTKLLRPLGELIAYLHDALPLNRELVELFKDNQNYLPVLKDIAGQFKADSGSTLRDVVNRLEVAANEAKHAAEELRIKAGVLKEEVAIVKALATSDRAEAAHKLVLLDGLIVRVDELVARIKNGEIATSGITPSTIPSAQQPVTSTTVPIIPGTNVIAVVEAKKVE